MKKINHSVSLKLISMTGPIHSVPSDAANAVYGQLMAKQDVHYFHENDEVIIPYHAIAYAELDVSSSSVDAPSDDICPVTD